MPRNPPGTNGSDPGVPSMLDLVRLSPRLLFPPGGVDLYRHIALLANMSEGDEVLVVACGKGVTLEYFVREHDVRGSGVDVDPHMVALAEERTREEGLRGRLQFQTGRSDSLPYRDGIFDVAVGELGLAAQADPAEAVRELARVTRPGGVVVLAQLAWKTPVEEARRHVLSQQLGAHPLMAVEWKRLLKGAGVGEIFSQDWSDEETVGPGAKPFFDFAEIFSLPEKATILRRAWGRWGLRGVRTMLAREGEVHRLLTRERLLRLDLLKGRKLPEGEAERARALPGPEKAESPELPELPELPEVAEATEEANTPASPSRDFDQEHAQTDGLPLFRDGTEDGGHQ
jgi:SAM-dependent methyltransferase